MPSSLNEFSEEKIRGALTSVASGMTSGLLNVMGVSVGLSPIASTVIFTYLVGSILGYVTDVLFAKRSFQLTADGPMTIVPYSQFAPRIAWMLRSFIGRQFYRYVITVLLDTLIGVAILSATVRFLDQRQMFKEFKYRDAVIAVIVSVFTFFLYVNILRFDWAYSDKDDPFLNIVVLMWSTLVLMIFAVTSARSPPLSSSPSDPESNSKKPDDERTGT